MSLGKDLTTLLWKKEILDNNAFLIPGNLFKKYKKNYSICLKFK
jgi:hypothetical protein